MNNPNQLTIQNRLSNLRERRVTCYSLVKVFLENEDAHGIHDMGVEIQALDRAIKELEKLFDAE